MRVVHENWSFLRSLELKNEKTRLQVRSWSSPVAVFFQSWDRTFKHYSLTFHATDNIENMLGHAPTTSAPYKYTTSPLPLNKCQRMWPQANARTTHQTQGQNRICPSRCILSQIQMACLWMSPILPNLCSSTEVQQMLPTILFHWRVWEVKDNGKPIKKVCLSFLIHSESAQLIPSIPPGLIPKWTYICIMYTLTYTHFLSSIMFWQ